MLSGTSDFSCDSFPNRVKRHTISLSDMIDKNFEYVVERQLPHPICFGSKLARDTAPIGKGLSAFQRRAAPETFPNIGPGQYSQHKYKTATGILNKIRSNKGVGPLASDDPRFKTRTVMRTPSPTKYNVRTEYGARMQQKVPFTFQTGRSKIILNDLPGPGTYTRAARKCRRTRFMYNFGNPTMIPTIEIICIPKAVNSCMKCNKICPGDYWQKDHTIFLCHLCWEEEKHTHETYNEKELKAFKKMRDCSFTHQHEGTTAAIRLLPPRKVTKKLRLENYLDLYITC